jgi:hypothetical protein
MKRFWFLPALVGSALGAQTVLYVNPQSGSDDNKGSASKPFASLEKARDAIRTMKKAGLPLKKGVSVELTGTFAMPDKTFALEANDGGSSVDAPVVYRASKSGALIIGGYFLPAKGFRTVTDAATLSRLPEGARGKVVSFDLKSVGLSGLAPLPDKFNGWSEMEGFSNGKAMRLARWPNTW